MTTYLCASCGREERHRWDAPCFGLCEECELAVALGPSSWPVEKDQSPPRNDTEQ
ncbi:hypothetical protein [Desulfobulbus sp.]|uniref:hypothetical protein n=1 Tax=Desulfobulbus sp. TaxID=895 RepID=UPI00286F0624|nr:hypothetical protein [Desulfobulbus sp.]